MHAVVLRALLLLLLGVRGAAGRRKWRATAEGLAPESLAQRRQRLTRLGVVGKAARKDAKCETEVQGDAPAVVLLSGTGEGKSTTTCVLSGDPALAHVASDNKVHSETNHTCIHRASWFYPYDHTEPLYLLDTPGFADTRGAEVEQANNEDIVATLKRAGHVHAILWVLNSQNDKMNKGRAEAFRFVRSYFGQDIYKHLVFVYTRYAWKFKRGSRRFVKGEARRQVLMDLHRQVMQALVDGVEKEFWPDGQVDQRVKDSILQLPCFAINTRTLEEDDGSMVLDDADLPEDTDYEDDPNVVYNPEAFSKGVDPNSATQLRDLKEKVLEIARGPPVDLTDLRPFQDGCLAALTDTRKTDPVVFGQHVTDCVEGQQYKLLKGRVVPHVHGLEDGPVFAAFCISAYTAGRGAKGSSLRAEAMKELGVPDSVRGDVEAFTSYGAYVSCRDVAPGQSEAAVAESLSTCLGGMAEGRGTPVLVQAMKERFFSDEAKALMSSKYVASLVAEIGRLPEDKRAIVDAHIDFGSFMSRRVLFEIRGPNGNVLQTSKVSLSASTTYESIMDGTVNKSPVVNMLREQGWVGGVSLYASDGAILTSDGDLRDELEEILAGPGPGPPPAALAARVTWVAKSPPQQLDPQLLKICLDRGDPLAAAALVRDHVTSPKMLIFTAEPEQVMPNTAQHGPVFSDVVALRGAEVERFRNATRAERAKRVEERRRIVEEVQSTRQMLQPYLDEVKGDAGDRTREATQLQQDMTTKVNTLLREIQASNVLRLPTQVPPTTTPAELFAFTAKLDEDLRTAEDVSSDRPVLGVEELLWQSRVLKGVYIGQVFEPKSTDLIQITKVPDINSVMTPPEGIKQREEMSSRSAETIASAKQSMQKGGSSFASSASASGVGMGSWGIGAVHMAGKVSSTMAENAQIAERSRTETQSFHSMRKSFHPMRLLELGSKNFRLTSAFMERAAYILHKDEALWPNEIEGLFSVYGTHYCPSVEMGGIWIAEANFDSSTSFSDSDAKAAVSKCFSAEFEVGGGGFFGAGFAKVSGSGRSESCKASSTNEATQTQKLMRSTRVTRSCISNMNLCPANEDVFIAGLRVNSNWAVIDRKLSKCVSVWDALNSRAYAAELLQTASGPSPGGAAPGAASVDRLLALMAKVWHLRALNLPGLCAEVVGEGDPRCRDVMALASGPPAALIEAPQQEIRSLWDSVQAKAAKMLDFSRRCSAMDWCNKQHGNGACKMNPIPGTTTSIMTCDCYPTFRGEFCAEKIPRKHCTKWRTNYCTAHNINDHQPACEEQWDKQYVYDDWEYCWSGFGGAFICKNAYTCQPDKEGADCCGSLEDGERWNKGNK